MHVSAKDKNTGKENKITIKSNSGLSEAEIEQMVKDAEANAEADKKRRELVDTRNSSEGFINEIKNDLKEHGDKISEDEKAKINETMTALEEELKSEDVEKIRAKLNEFMQASNPLTSAKVKPAEAKPEEPTDKVVDVEATEVKST